MLAGRYPNDWVTWVAVWEIAGYCDFRWYSWAQVDNEAYVVETCGCGRSI